MRYPNLLEVVNWHICGKPAIADHAGVTRELLEAVLCENEELTHDEMIGISRLVEIPVNVLELPELVLMNCNKFQHKAKIMDLYEDFAHIKTLRTAIGKGNDTAIKVAETKLDTYTKYFKRNSGSYVGYRAVLQAIEWNFWLYHNIDQKKPRGLRK